MSVETSPQFNIAMQATSVYSFPASLSGNNVALVKGGAGSLFMIDGFNTSGGAVYVKVYDSATTPDVGSGAPKLRKVIPSQSSIDNGQFPSGIVFNFGIAVVFTKYPQDEDKTPINQGDVMTFNLAFS